MPLTNRQTALLLRPLSSLGKLSAQAQNSLITDAHKFRNPDIPLKLTPKSRKELLRAYTIGDVFGRWKHVEHIGPRANPTGLTFPHGHVALVIDLLVKAGFTRFDHPWLPQETLTLKVMRTRSKEEWLDTPLYYLGTLPRFALAMIAYELGKGDYPSRWRSGRYLNKDPLRSLSVRDLLRSCDAYVNNDRSWRVSPRTLWETREQSMTNTQKLLSQLGFVYEDSPIMQFRTERRLIEDLVRRHKIGMRTARMVIRIAKSEGWKVDKD